MVQGCSPRGGSSRAKPLPASISFGKAGISPRCVKERQPQALISLPPRAEAPFSHLSLPTPSQGQTWPGPALPTGRLPRRQMFSINNKIRSRKAAEIERANLIRLEKKNKKKFFARRAKGLRVISSRGASLLKPVEGFGSRVQHLLQAETWLEGQGKPLSIPISLAALERRMRNSEPKREFVKGRREREPWSLLYFR